MAEINRRSVLLECLEYERGLQKLCSVDHQGRLPLEGSEDLFYEQAEKCRILQEMIQALGNEQVRRAMADWQKEIMLYGIQTELKFDEERNQEGDVPDHQEEQRVFRGDDPVQHGHEMEHKPV